jgi:hypothetical protein
MLNGDVIGNGDVVLFERKLKAASTLGYAAAKCFVRARRI